MVLVLENLGLHLGQLFGDRSRVVVVESVPFARDLEPHGDKEPVLQRAVQHLAPAILAVLRSPSAEGIPSVKRQLLLAAELKAGALDVEELSVDKQLVAVRGFADFNFGNRTGLRFRIGRMANGRGA